MTKLFCSTLAILMAAWPCRGAKGKPQTPPVIGQIVQSSSATVDGVPALPGGTVLAGDTLATAQGGSALVSIPGGGQVELSENTTIGFSGSPGHVVGKLAEGMIVAHGPDPEFLVIETAQCRIQPAAKAAATFAVSVSSDGKASVTAQTASISVTEIGSGQAHTLATGETFACAGAAGPAPAASQGREESKPAPGEQAGQAAPPSKPAKHSNTGLLILLLGGGAAAGIGAAAAGGHGGGGGGPASPSAP